ncbi:MAG: hypothetical protein WAK56_05810, partial [Candidatus Sulfotelmatobacter sp.]
PHPFYSPLSVIACWGAGILPMLLLDRVARFSNRRRQEWRTTPRAKKVLFQMPGGSMLAGIIFSIVSRIPGKDASRG